MEGGYPKYNDLLYIPKEEDIQNYLFYKKSKKDINKLIFEDEKDEMVEEMEEEDYIKKYENIKNNFKIIDEIKDKNVSYGQMNKNKYFNNELISLMKYYNNINNDKEDTFHSNIINSNFTIKLKVS